MSTNGNDETIGSAFGSFMTKLGALCGMVALVWVSYLSGLDRRPEAKRATAGEIDEELPAADELAKDEPGPEEKPPKAPEVWTRMAGLNVWIAGKRERDGEETPRIVVMLHGFAKSRDTLLMIAERESEKFGTTFIFPEAPVALDWRRRAWWRPRVIPGLGIEDTELPSENHISRPASFAKELVVDRPIMAARKRILALLEEVKREFNVTSGEILLAGFSQGATLALDVALNMNEKLGGIAFLSGKALYLENPLNEFRKLKGTPILVAHGRRDPLASFEATHKMKRTMEQAGLDVTWVPYNGAHQISRGAQLQLGRFIRGIVGDEEGLDVPAQPVRLNPGGRRGIGDGRNAEGRSGGGGYNGNGSRVEAGAESQDEWPDGRPDVDAGRKRPARVLEGDAQ